MYAYDGSSVNVRSNLTFCISTPMWQMVLL